MYSPPDSFLARMREEFGTRLRIRWSKAHHEYHIEQQVGRAALLPFRMSEIDDRYIRAKDGYAFVMAVKAGNHVPCKTCGLKCSVPECVTSEIICAYCEGAKKRRGREFGGYWPLSEVLIEYLKSIDPLRDGHIRNIAQNDLSQEAAEAGRSKMTHDTIEAATLNDKNQIFNVPNVGYTGNPRPGTSFGRHSF